jgi:hypothetical protein
LKERILPSALLIAALSAALLATGCHQYTEGLKTSTTRADETAAIAALHSITSAQRMYSLTNNASYGTFAQLVQGSFLDSRFSADQPKMRGYVLTMTVKQKAEGTDESSYALTADPEPTLAGRHFYIDSTSGIIRVNVAQTATASDPPAEQ